MEQHLTTVSDQQADASLRTLVTGPVVRATDIVADDDSVESSASGAVQDPCTNSLPASALRFLRAVLANPMLRSSEYAKLAGVSPNTAAKVRAVLIEQGLIREHKLESGARGRAAILLEPLEAAKRLLAEGGGASS
ncbi:hypothetical protein [Anaerobaca lacustris]|uniref:MarR family transcriptional regulator n=1 Tax=Anaerobaca lacustris TaxID=3044600 RepID=A0AAW6U3I3_9BACT|nr:hypothetical protein [Sedimentisphaerales bacterium M17dextr]